MLSSVRRNSIHGLRDVDHGLFVRAHIYTLVVGNTRIVSLGATMAAEDSYLLLLGDIIFLRVVGVKLFLLLVVGLSLFKLLLDSRVLLLVLIAIGLGLR